MGKLFGSQTSQSSCRQNLPADFPIAELHQPDPLPLSWPHQLWD